jgi:hypothetical protein
MAPLLKNEWTKRLYRALGLRPPFKLASSTDHFRIPSLEQHDGWLQLADYAGPVIPKEEWESLEYITYATDPNTFFAPLTSATGETVLRGFWEDGKPDLDGIWTANAEHAPTMRQYLDTLGCRMGRVQLIRQEPTSLREARWGLHLDDNNRLNEDNGWVVRLWIQLTDNPDSALLLRSSEFGRSTEVRIPLAKGTQVLVDSERLFHGAVHAGPERRYALIVSLESCDQLEKWVQEHARATPERLPTK